MKKTTQRKRKPKIQIYLDDEMWAFANSESEKKEWPLTHWMISLIKKEMKRLQK